MRAQLPLAPQLPPRGSYGCVCVSVCACVCVCGYRDMQGLPDTNVILTVNYNHNGDQTDGQSPLIPL